jgi:uncharacterized OsmC-like protein
MKNNAPKGCKVTIQDEERREKERGITISGIEIRIEAGFKKARFILTTFYWEQYKLALFCKVS